MSDNGFFGKYGGMYVAEVLRRPLDELKQAFDHYMNDREFLDELDTIRRDYIGRETPLYYAPTATKLLGGAQVYIKLEGLANTGAHKINNAIGQCLLAKRMGKKRIIAETGAGQHGVATAAACANLVLNVLYTWAKSMSDVSSQMLPQWSFMEQKLFRLQAEAVLSRMPSMKQ